MSGLLVELLTQCTALAGLLSELEGGSGAAVYGTLVLILILGVFFVPVPEEAAFAIAGALAARGQVDVTLAYLLGWTVVLTLDMLLYLVGKGAGPSLRRSRFARGIGEARWSHLEDWIERRGVWAVVAARFVMGARIPVFLLAGAAGMPRARFVAAAAGAGLLSAGLPYALGYGLGAHLESLLETLATFRWALFAFAVVMVLCWWLWRRRP